MQVLRSSLRESWTGNVLRTLLSDALRHQCIGERFGSDHLFFQENDPKHTAAAACNASGEINRVRALPESPDLNPIEHVWRSMKEAKPGTKQQLVQATEVFWEAKLPKISVINTNQLKKMLIQYELEM